MKIIPIIILPHSPTRSAALKLSALKNVTNEVVCYVLRIVVVWTFISTKINNNYFVCYIIGTTNVYLLSVFHMYMSQSRMQNRVVPFPFVMTSRLLESKRH